MSAIAIEERLSALEAEISELKTRLPKTAICEPQPWWEQISGIFKDDPMFDEAMRLGKEWRDSDKIGDCEPCSNNEKLMHVSA